MANKKIPMRKCVGCQEMKEKKSLIRVVKTAEGDIILDDTGKKNGRGAYICKSCLLYTSPSPRDRTRSRMPSSA